MTVSVSLILLVALVLDWRFGEPEFLWSRIPHPVVLFGKAVAFLDVRLNRTAKPEPAGLKAGGLAIAALVLLALAMGAGLETVLHGAGWVGSVIECLLVSVFLAQRSLYDHVNAVALALREEGLIAARKKVGLIVGRDPDLLDEEGVCRASIETLAENFSDGVVAPAFWYLIFGLPGLLVYKMINTADSMIAHKNAPYLYFGRATAQVDDLANWLPARISAGLLAAASALVGGAKTGRYAMAIAVRDAGLHRSPNAGWPEAAMAGGLNIALGGPRFYPQETVQQAHLNATGKKDLSAADIGAALQIFSRACQVLWVVVALVWLMIGV